MNENISQIAYFRHQQALEEEAARQGLTAWLLLPTMP